MLPSFRVGGVEHLDESESIQDPDGRRVSLTQKASRPDKERSEAVETSERGDTCRTRGRERTKWIVPAWGPILILPSSWASGLLR